MLVSTYCADAPVELGAADAVDAALPAPDPAPVAGAMVRLSHVFRQPVTVVAVFAMSLAAEVLRVAGGCEVGLGDGSGGRWAGWLGGVCSVGGVCGAGCGCGCWAARPRPDIATMLHAARKCFFMRSFSLKA
jgi:hypothetical protein